MTQNQTTLTLLGWVPLRGLLYHALWHTETFNLVRPIGEPHGGYIWTMANKPREQQIEWDQWPDDYERMEREVLADGANEFTMRVYGNPL